MFFRGQDLLCEVVQELVKVDRTVTIGVQFVKVRPDVLFGHFSTHCFPVEDEFVDGYLVVPV